MDEDTSLQMAQDVEREAIALSEVVLIMKDAIAHGIDLPVAMAPGLVAFMEAQHELIKTLYEFWALVGDKIQQYGNE